MTDKQELEEKIELFIVATDTTTTQKLDHILALFNEEEIVRKTRREATIAMNTLVNSAVERATKDERNQLEPLLCPRCQGILNGTVKA